jgi:hypothetical protein
MTFDLPRCPGAPGPWSSASASGSWALAQHFCNGCQHGGFKSKLMIIYLIYDWVGGTWFCDSFLGHLRTIFVGYLLIWLCQSANLEGSRDVVWFGNDQIHRMMIERIETTFATVSPSQLFWYRVQTCWACLIRAVTDRLNILMVKHVKPFNHCYFEGTHLTHRLKLFVWNSCSWSLNDDSASSTLNADSSASLSRLRLQEDLKPLWELRQ